MARQLIRTSDGTLVPFGLSCAHLWQNVGLGYFAVFQPGEEQPDYYCEECYDRLLENQPVTLDRCCMYCAKELLARHILLGEVESSDPQGAA